MDQSQSNASLKRTNSCERLWNFRSVLQPSLLQVTSTSTTVRRCFVGWKSSCFIALLLFSLNFELSYGVCARAEYEIDGECCPMCAPGNRVYRHCTEYTSTTCVPCMGSTFIDAPNGLLHCFACSVCDPGQGLRVKTPCTRTSDTVCEPQVGYYCKDQDRGSCSLAEKHMQCKSGQYIKQKGTAFKDTECDACKDGTFSNGTNCQLHTKCEDKGLIEINPGTFSTDTECGHKPPLDLILGLIFTFLVLTGASVAAVFIIYKKKGKKVPCIACLEYHRAPIQETEMEEQQKVKTVTCETV